MEPSSPEPTSPSLSAADVRLATGDFPRRHLWVRVFTVLNGVSVLFNAVSLNVVGLAFSAVLFVASLSAWRATTLFTAAHESGNKAAMFDALEQLETYFRVSTITLIVGVVLMALMVLLMIVAVLVLGVGLMGMRS